MSRLGKVRVLVVDEDEKRAELFSRCLQNDFEIVQGAPSGSVSRLTDEGNYDVVVRERTGVGLFGDYKLGQNSYEVLQTIVGHEGDVLLVGELGVGKSLVARCVHESQENRSDFRVIRLQHLEEVERNTILLTLDLGQGETLFVDGIDLLSFATQGRLASRWSKGHEGRIIAASTKKLNDDNLHPSLVHYFSERVHTLPSLRFRGEDIPRLATLFVSQLCQESGRAKPRIAREAMAELCIHEWPGNVAELRICIAKALDRCTGDEIRAEFIGERPQSPLVDRVVDDVISRNRGLDAAMAELEAAVIRETLILKNGNRSATARQLKLPRQTLQDRMKKHGLWGGESKGL